MLVLHRTIGMYTIKRCSYHSAIARISRNASFQDALCPAGKTISKTKERKSSIKATPPPREERATARSTRAAAPVSLATRKRLAQAAAAAATPASAAASSAQKAKKDNAEDYVVPIKEYVKPQNQLRLSEAELDEDLACSLSSGNPNAPSNIARFVQKDSAFKVETSVDQMLHHYSTDGWLAYREPVSLSRQTSVRSQARSATKDLSNADTQAQFDDETGRLHNQFNFNDRAVQTKVSKPQDAMMMTEPPPSKDAGGSTSQSRIFDAYKAHQEKGRAAEDQAKARSAAVARRGIGEPASIEDPAKEQEKQSRQEMERMTQLVQRMCNQNLQHDLISDFKYWDDPADAIQQQEGTLLPLWRFTAAAAHGLHVTALCWNPAYPDLFAAGYGSFDARRQGPGAAICFSLKDPVNPIFERHTASGVMSLDFHPQQGNILAVGLYSGNIEVHNVMSKDSSHPLYKTSAAAGKHLDAVTTIRWLNGASAGLRGLMFYSTSADGHVYQWLLGKSAMTFQEFYTMRADAQRSKSAKASAWDTIPQNAAPPYGATCMDFHKDQGHIVLVGTEEGRMHRCSTALAQEALSTYTGHSDPVYCVHWNRRHPDVFLSTSADWTVKLWLSSRSQAVMTFDLGCPVGDAAWAPYSATVFAAVGDDGCVQVFDLAANKRDPVSKQKIHAKAGLTRISFNTHHPVLLIGDDRGCVHCLKLSPNLRRQPQHKAPSGAQAKSSGAAAKPVAAVDAGIQQLDAILLVALKSMATEENQDKINEELKIIQEAWQQAKAT